MTQFLQNSGSLPPAEWGEWARSKFGWDADRINAEWKAFGPDFWLTDNCLGYDGGRKRDWVRLGALTAPSKPATAAEAEQIAIALTQDLLPPTVQQWPSAMEQHSLVAASIPGKHPPAAPTLIQQEREALSLQAKSLSEVLQPARDRGTELEQAIISMFVVMNVYTGDQAKLTLRVNE